MHIASHPPDPGLIASIGALIGAGLTGIAAVIKAWAQLLYARADMIRARSGRPAVASDGQVEAEPADGSAASSSEPKPGA